MVAVADLERFLERVFERTSARLFRSRVQAVQVGRRVERAMEAGRTGRGATTAVPNRFRVRLHPSDLHDLADRGGGPEALAVSLADQALAFARLHSYHLVARPTVSLVADPSAERGMVEVDASVWRPTAGAAPGVAVGSPAVGGPAEAAPGGQAPPPEPDEAPAAPDGLGALVTPAPPSGKRDPAGHAPETPAPEAAAPSPTDEAALPLPAEAPAADGQRAAAAPGPAAATPGPAPATPAPDAAPAASPGGPSAAVSAPATSPRTGGIRGAGDRRYAVRPAVPPPARALLRVTGPDGREREVRVEGQPLTLGRAPDNGLVLSDARVSRHHGRFVNRHGTLVYTDLGSTNGTHVNGIRVDEIVLGAGDRLQVGDVVVVVEQLPG